MAVLDSDIDDRGGVAYNSIGRAVDVCSSDRTGSAHMEAIGTERWTDTGVHLGGCFMR